MNIRAKLWRAESWAGAKQSWALAGGSENRVKSKSKLAFTSPPWALAIQFAHKSSLEHPFLSPHTLGLCPAAIPGSQFGNLCNKRANELERHPPPLSGAKDGRSCVLGHSRSKPVLPGHRSQVQGHDKGSRDLWVSGEGKNYYSGSARLLLLCPGTQLLQPGWRGYRAASDAAKEHMHLPTCPLYSPQVLPKIDSYIYAS